ncbi:MBL fold metallo-hydrolase [Halorussus limi]|uniref:MBL fold metallo-hydrolase n=1 Tax=Halorussus limi TaxID=2938695 RepID=A0A8U0HQ18_9EURY|nr:MBL fold metallo-hydrolase [Halorussus limi]UPV72843.1 MBL fold metallo-hydrolase [Halorussus limi]
MSEPEFPTPDADVERIDPEALRDRIEGGEEVFVLDTRAPDDAEEWAIDGENVESLNVPYFEFLAGDPDEAVFERLPDGREITVVCAKGHASEYVAGELIERGYDARTLADGMQGWARIFEYTEIDAATDATVAQYQRPSSGCMSYLVVSGDEAAVVDPLRAFTDTYRRDARSLGADLKYAIDTHVHADHVSGVRALADEAGAEGVLPAAAIDRGVTYGDEVTRAEDGDAFRVGDAEIEAVFTPGHTSGMTSYLVDDAVLLTGDGLFAESVARPDLEDGDEGAPDAARQLYESLQERVLALNDDVVVGGAHFSDAADTREDGTYTDTIGNLTEKMDALTMDEDEFVELVLSDMPPRPANYEEVIATNLGREERTDEEAFELELGPNNCAASSDAMTSDQR